MKNEILKFIGVGSAFNTGFGNTSAFFMCGETMILFDCGESVFGRIQGSELMDGVKSLKVFITHNHPDHVGSLGSLIFFCYFCKKIPVEVYGDQDLYSILKMTGVKDEQFSFKNISENFPKTFSFTPLIGNLEYKITPVVTKHADNLFCVGYHVKETNSEVSFYYSGDSSEIPSSVLNAFLHGHITCLYEDTSWLDYEGNVHLSYKKLCSVIDTRRDSVYIMHTDNNFNLEKAVHDGFKIAGKN